MIFGGDWENGLALRMIGFLEWNAELVYKVNEWNWKRKVRNDQM